MWTNDGLESASPVICASLSTRRGGMVEEVARSDDGKRGRRNGTFERIWTSNG